MITEVHKTDIVDGIQEVLKNGAIVVRNVVDPSRALALNSLIPQTGKKRVYLSRSLCRENLLRIPMFDESRAEIRTLIASHLGKNATLWGAYVMRPDMLRSGRTKGHIDGRGAIISASLNIDLGDGQPTGFFAHKIDQIDAPYSALVSKWELNDITETDMPSCELGIGDMVIMARGVVHGSIAPTERKAITYRTRGLIVPDFR